MALLDGQAVFGGAVRVQVMPNADATQINAFFGVSGQQVLYGGSRGGRFLISGCLIGPDISTINNAENTLFTFADGQGHVLTDNRGRQFGPVVFRREYQPDERGPRWTVGGGGYSLAYRMVLEGLS